MNEEIKKKIEKKYGETFGGALKVAAAEYGYSLAEAEIERLKGLIKKLWALDVTYTTWKQFCETNKL